MDRWLGYMELHLSELATDADSMGYPYRSIGKRVEAAHLKLENGAFQGRLHYEAEFVPAVALKDLKFSTSGRHIRRTVECANRDAAGGNASVNFSHKEVEAVPTGITTYRPLAEEKRNKLPTNRGGKYKSVEGVTMSEEDLMKYCELQCLPPP